MVNFAETDGSEDPELYPEPEPAHPQDGVSTEALPHPRHSVRYQDHLRALEAEREAREQRDRRRAAEEELERARRIIGSGPFAVVKLSSLNDLTDSGAVEVRVGFGGGVARHMLPAVLALGIQAAREAEPIASESAHGEQENTVRLPPVMPEHLDGEGERCGCMDLQPAETTQEPPERSHYTMDRYSPGPY
jgi:hypothetical protein